LLEGISGIVDKVVCIDTVYLGFCKAFDLGAGDILVKSISCRNNCVHTKITKSCLIGESHHVLMETYLSLRLFQPGPKGSVPEPTLTFYQPIKNMKYLLVAFTVDGKKWVNSRLCSQ